MPVITIFRGARAPEPVDTRDLPWPVLARQLELLANEPTGAPPEADEREQKKRMIAWGPYALRVPYRAAENVDHLSMLVVDVDNDDRKADPVTPEVIAARMHAERVEGLIYESPRSTPALPKFRVIATLASPIPPSACRETRTRFAEVLGLGPKCGVHGAIDAAKLFVSGRIHGTPPRRVWHIPGAPLDAATLPPNSEAWGAAFREAPASAPHLAELPPADQGIVAAIGDWRQHAGRKWSVCGAVGGVMRKFGYAPEACEAVIRAWLPTDDPTVDVDAGVAWALGSWGKDPADVSGHDELARHVGDAHALVIERAVHLGTSMGQALEAARVEVAARAPLAVPATPWLTPVARPDDHPFGTRHSIADDDPPIPYICRELCLAPNLGGKISLIGGLPGAGKGPLAAYISVCVALGVPLFGVWPVVQSRILYLDVEGHFLTKRRMRRIARSLGRDPRELDAQIDLWEAGRLELLDERTYRALEAHDARLVVLDSYTTAMLRYDLDTNKNEYARGAQALAALRDRAVLPVTHMRKPSGGSGKEVPTLADIAGSGALGALAQTGISVWHPDDAAPHMIRVACLRAPEAVFTPFDVEFADEPGGGLALRMITSEERAEADRADANAEMEAVVNAVLSFLCSEAVPRSTRDIANLTLIGAQQISERQATGALALLRRAGLIVEHRGVGARRADWEIRSVQETPACIRLTALGEIDPTPIAAGGFRRPT